jgi:hypothetical protein
LRIVYILVDFSKSVLLTCVRYLPIEYISNCNT